jgi:multiple sugar transport system permease protein/raffinose/stachyose/melibiose transport system permease protein
MKLARLKRTYLFGVDIFTVATLFILIIWVILTIIPIFRLFGLALRSPDATGENYFYLVPRVVTLRNFLDAFPFLDDYTVALPRAFMNSTIYTLVGLAGAMIVSILAAFAFATMEFRGKHTLFTILLLGLVVPISAMLLPEYITIGVLGLRNTYWSLILPYIAFSTALPILILTSFFKQIPQELYDAAKLDGSNSFQFLITIGVPLAKPAIATSIIWQFIYLWNEFPLALVLLVKEDLYNLPVAILSMMTARNSPWHLISAVMIIATIPVILSFIFFQNFFIEGLTEGALKE